MRKTQVGIGQIKSRKEEIKTLHKAVEKVTPLATIFCQMGNTISKDNCLLTNKYYTKNCRCDLCGRIGKI